MLDQKQQVQQVQQQEDVFKHVLNRIKSFQETGELYLPKDYSPENALKGAYLIISELKNKSNEPALNICTRESISKSLLKMVTEGLSPLKKQGSFIVYGNQLQWQREYAGNIALAKRFGGLKDIRPVAIFEGDIFEFTIEDGVRKVTSHLQTLDSIGSKNLRGAYAICVMEDGRENVEIMNINQIKDAWNQGYAKGGSPAHKNFPDQMAMKTVISRACKLLINSSNDSALIDDSLEDATIDITSEEVKSEIKANANKEEILMPMPKEDAKFVPTMIIESAQEEVPEAFS